MNVRIAAAAAAVGLILFSASLADAGVTAVETVQIDPGVALSGFVANDILVDFDGRFGGQQMILELTQGSIFQNDFGNITPPIGELISLFPEMEFDSFVTVGGGLAAESAGVLVVGGAVNLGGAPALSFDLQKLDVTWAAALGTFIPQGDDFLVSRITLSNDAQGTFKYFGSTLDGGNNAWIGEASISNGVIGRLAAMQTQPPVIETPTDPLPPPEIPTQFPDTGDPVLPISPPGLPEVETPLSGWDDDPLPAEDPSDGRGGLDVEIDSDDVTPDDALEVPRRIFYPPPELIHNIRPRIGVIDWCCDSIGAPGVGFEVIDDYVIWHGTPGDVLNIDSAEFTDADLGRFLTAHSYTTAGPVPTFDSFAMNVRYGQSRADVTGGSVPEPQSIALAMMALVACLSLISRRGYLM